MKRSRLIWMLLLLTLGSLLTSCTLTPHANVGVDFHMSNGKIKARPNAEVGVYGRP